MRLKGGDTLDLFAQLSTALFPAREPSSGPPPRGRRAAPRTPLPPPNIDSVARRLQPARARDQSTRLELSGITLALTRKRVRHLRLSVHPPHGDVRVSAPLRMSMATIRTFVLTRLDWIRAQQQKVCARDSQAPPAYVDGEIHAVWGQPYSLAVMERAGAPRVELKDGVLCLRVRPGSTVAQKQRLLTAWHRTLIEAAATPLITRWELVMRVSVARVSARHMTTRWGSCTPRSRQIRLSTELALKTPACLEYVVVHEMVHLLEASHGRRFVRLMDRFMPDWRERRAALNGPRKSC